jgi:hypothetical protein
MFGYIDHPFQLFSNTRRNLMTCSICCDTLDDESLIRCPGGCYYCHDCFRQAILNEIYKGATTTRLKLCQNCEIQFDDDAIEAILDENDRELLRINDQNAEVWSHCPECSVLTCSECWKEVDPGGGCQCDQDIPLSEAEVRSSAVVRSCPRCRTRFG